jgi:hypothetical protein
VLDELTNHMDVEMIGDGFIVSPLFCIQYACACSSPDALVLDEPTHHIDVEMIGDALWFMAFIMDLCSAPCHDGNACASSTFETCLLSPPTTWTWRLLVLGMLL